MTVPAIAKQKRHTLFNPIKIKKSFFFLNHHFFTPYILGIPCGFLNVDISSEKDITDYQIGKQIAQSLNVVNDVAEWGGVINFNSKTINLNFNSILTQDEDQKQYLMQVVEDNYKKLPGCKTL